MCKFWGCEKHRAPHGLEQLSEWGLEGSRPVPLAVCWDVFFVFCPKIYGISKLVVWRSKRTLLYTQSQTTLFWRVQPLILRLRQKIWAMRNPHVSHNELWKKLPWKKCQDVMPIAVIWSFQIETAKSKRLEVSRAYRGLPSYVGILINHGSRH